MKLAGMMRVKNEARWIRQVLEAAVKVADHVYVMDDHSTDDTPAICASFGIEKVTVYASPFRELNEARDKNWLLNQIRANGAEWVLAIDGDELLMSSEEIREEIGARFVDCYALQVLYLWDRTDQVRTDGVYGRFWRPSLFRLRPGDTFRSTKNGGNFHCGNVPKEFIRSARSRTKLLHFGYMEQADRRRKFDWYNQIDPQNVQEDRYRHMIQGDPGGPPADTILRHAGPLSLKAISI